jgi:hypothetical protein
MKTHLIITYGARVPLQAGQKAIVSFYFVSKDHSNLIEDPL